VVLVLRFINAGEELHAVAHRNLDFSLAVMTLDVISEVALFLGLLLGE
jgi:hypothetical protein